MRIKTALTLLSCLALSACGFSPVYGTYSGTHNAAVASSLDSIYIDTIPDRSGQKLRNILMDQFYQTGRKDIANAGYRLHISGLGESIYGLGIAKDATATRSQIKLTTVFTLSRLNDPEGKALISRTVEAISSFDTLASEYTTLVTEDDARDQVIHDMADQISTLLELYFTNPSKFPTPEQLAEQDKKEGKTPNLSRDAHAYIDDDLKATK